MENAENLKQEFLLVPHEIVMEVLKILLDNKVKFRVDSIRERENSVYLEALFDLKQPYHQKALENIINELGFLKQFMYEGISVEI